MCDDRQKGVVVSMEVLQWLECNIKQHVAVNDKNILESRTQIDEAACGTARCGLDNYIERYAKRVCFSGEHRSKLIAKVPGEHDNTLHALASKQAHLADNNWNAADRQQGFRDTIPGHGGGPCPPAPCDDGGVHDGSEPVRQDALDREADRFGRVPLRLPAGHLQS